MIINMYNATDVNSGEIGIYTVTIHIGYDRTYSMYRCAHPSTPGQTTQVHDGIPQGDRIHGTPEELETMARLLFPIAVRAGYKPAL